MIRYEGDIYRPPSEAGSLLIQATVGCSHNKCTFCNMYKTKRFHIRKQEDILADLEWARKTYSYVGRIFLCDGDALCLANHKLVEILDAIRKLFPECQRIGVYARSNDINRKTDEELKELRNHGLGIAYIGAESGSDKILKRVNKGETAEEILLSINRMEDMGIPTSVTFISGLGGKELREEHAVETGRMISEMKATYVSLLTLMLTPVASLWDEVQRGEFQLLTPKEVLEETCLLLENANPKTSCIFRSNHASNYVSLRGNLPEDKERMLMQLRRALTDTGYIKDEWLRGL